MYERFDLTLCCVLQLCVYSTMTDLGSQLIVINSCVRLSCLLANKLQKNITPTHFTDRIELYCSLQLSNLSSIRINCILIAFLFPTAGFDVEQDMWSVYFPANTATDYGNAFSSPNCFVFTQNLTLAFAPSDLSLFAFFCTSYVILDPYYQMFNGEEPNRCKMLKDKYYLQLSSRTDCAVSNVASGDVKMITCQ